MGISPRWGDVRSNGVIPTTNLTISIFFGSEAVYLGGKLGNTLQGPSDLVGGVINPMLTLHDSMRELGKLRFLWVQFHQ